MGTKAIEAETIQPISEDPDLLTQTQAVRYTGRSYGALTHAVARGHLRFRTVAGIPLFSREDLDKLPPIRRGRPRHKVKSEPRRARA